MKPLLIAFTLLFSVVTNHSFASGPDVNPVVLKAFKKSFNNVSNVQWSQVENLYKATFTINNQEVCTFYNEDGYLVASSRYITASQLPEYLQTDLEKYKNDYRVKEIFEVSDESGIKYFTTIEKGGKLTLLKSSAARAWSVYKKAAR